jgi:hypothetical protein
MTLETIAPLSDDQNVNLPALAGWHARPTPVIAWHTASYTTPGDTIRFGGGYRARSSGGFRDATLSRTSSTVRLRDAAISGIEDPIDSPA